MSENVMELTDATFDQEVLQSTTPVLVDFWAEWCAPCRMVAPILEQLANDYAGKVKFAKLDVDHNRVAAQKFGIQSIPTLLVFKGGKVVKKIVGARPRKDIKADLDAALE